MDEKIYYPAIFFSDIVSYYGGSVTYIEEQMLYNISTAKARCFGDFIKAIEELHMIKLEENIEDDQREGWRILQELQNIEVGDKEQKKIMKIKMITDRVKSMTRIDYVIYNKVLTHIQLLSENSSNTGYSDTNIIRFMDHTKNALKESKYNDIINYLIEPEAQNDYSDLSNRLQGCICSQKYGHIPQEEIDQIKRYLTRPDFSGKHILRIFRILEKCSPDFFKSDNKKNQEKVSHEIENDWKIAEDIMGALKNIWGEIEVEGVGITQEEKSKISFDVCQELLKDYKFYQKNTNYDIESAKGFQALIFYRLYNKIYYYMDNNYGNSEETEDMQKALAFYAFSILQRAIEHTEILLHPAAQIEAPVYIGERVMVGKQCKIEAECVLGENVCLYPFNIYNNEIQGPNMYIMVGGKTVFCKNTKVLGSIVIGRECVINKSILVGNSIENNRYIDKNNIVEIDDKMRLDKEGKVKEGIL